MRYRPLHIVRHWIPDGRLVHADVSDDGVMTFAYRAWHIHPLLVRDLGELARHVAGGSIFEVDPTRRDMGVEPIITSWVERAPGSDWAPGQTMAYRVGANPDPFFEIQVREELIDPALLRELNEEALPKVLAVLVPVTPAPGAR